MPSLHPPADIALLLSGGLDSTVLLGQLLAAGNQVQPCYVQAGLRWETCELAAVERILTAMSCPPLQPLLRFAMPLADLYGGHWSLTGQGVPDSRTEDEAVFLPGRNALLLLKPIIHCQLHGIGRLALAPLGTSPFADATPAFFEQLLGALNRGMPHAVRIELPFAQFDKRRVMQLGRALPLELTFSCIDPVAGQHCGHCNKCEERRHAFELLGSTDPTRYASAVSRSAGK